MEPTKPNARELSVIEYLAALDVQLCGRQDVLRERLARIPNGWRDRYADKQVTGKDL